MRLLVIAALLTFPLALEAVECTSDADCAADQYCARMESCAAPACPEGQECEAPVCSASGECLTAGPTGTDYVYGNECEVDADCPADFVCEELEVPCAGVPTSCACSCPACDPDSGAECPPCECSGCDDPEPTPCESSTAKLCAYHPQECTADADCAEGFQCVKDEICYGGTSAGCAVPDCACACEAGAECPPCECGEPVCDDEPVETETTCEVVGQYCAPRQIACTDATACPAGWECVAVPAYTCACPMIDCPPVETMCPDMAPECVAKAEACDDQAACDCPEQQPEAYCMPAGWGGVIAAQDQATGGEAAAPTGGAELGDFLSNAQEAAAGPRVVDDKAGTDDTTDGDGDEAASDTAGGGGCTVGGTSSVLGFLLLSLLALAGVTFVRRRV